MLQTLTTVVLISLTLGMVREMEPAPEVDDTSVFLVVDDVTPGVGARTLPATWVIILEDVGPVCSKAEVFAVGIKDP